MILRTQITHLLDFANLYLHKNKCLFCSISGGFCHLHRKHQEFIQWNYFDRVIEPR